MALNTYADLLQHELRDLYSAEQQFAERQAAMAGAASDPELRDALGQHVEVTHAQVERLEEVARALGVTPSGATSRAARTLLEEGERLIDAGGDPSVLDAALIAAAQKIEHFEIAAYGTLRALVRRSGHAGATTFGRTVPGLTGHGRLA